MRFARAPLGGSSPPVPLRPSRIFSGRVQLCDGLTLAELDHGVHTAVNEPRKLFFAFVHLSLVTHALELRCSAGRMNLKDRKDARIGRQRPAVDVREVELKRPARLGREPAGWQEAQLNERGEAQRPMPAARRLACSFVLAAMAPGQIDVTHRM